MYCGKLKKFCKDISIGELIEILKPYKDLKIKISTQSNFYIHFDQDGDYIELNPLDLLRLYGFEGKSCKECPRYKDGCICNGQNCVTHQLYKDMCNKSEKDDVIETVVMEEEDNDKYSALGEVTKSISIKLEVLSKEFDKLYNELMRGE